MATKVKTSMLDDLAVTNAKLRSSAAVSVIGRSVNSSGAPADIAASADGQVLKRAAGALSFSQIVTADITLLNITTALLANASVDDTKAGNRVVRFPIRQGNNANDWTTTGATSFVPTLVKMQGGASTISMGGTANAATTITFPSAYSFTPLVIAVKANAGLMNFNLAFEVITTTATTVQVRCQTVDGTLSFASVPFVWLAIGGG
jgi:hypothetical protein